MQKVPQALRKQLEEDLQNLIENDIIWRIEEATDWGPSLIIVREKRVDFQLYVDPKNQNEKHKKRTIPHAHKK